MGRPVKGARLGATGAATSTIPVRADIGGTDFEGFIVRQIGSRRYRVSNDGGSVVGNATLVDKVTGHAAGECSIVAFNTAGEAVTCAKLTNRLFTDFSDNKYTYALSDDSAESLMTVTAV